jgi:hypothetical protein
MNRTGGPGSTHAIGADETGTIPAEEMARAAETTMAANEVPRLVPTGTLVLLRMTRKRKESKSYILCIYAHILSVLCFLKDLASPPV